ncbi:MAG: hypothetical protein Kow0077_26560 [Anaerolineae bacterium]
MQIWDIEEGAQLAVFEQGFNLLVMFADLQFSHDNTMLALADGLTAQVWDTNTWTKIAQFPIGDIGSSVAFSPDDKLLAGSSWDGSSRVWDLLSGNTRFLLQHNSSVERVIFSPDGAVIYTAEGDSDASVIHIWDARRGVETEKIVHDTILQDIAISSDGSLLVSVSNDCDWNEGSSTIHFWDSHSYEMVRAIPVPDVCIEQIEFGAEGRLLLLSGDQPDSDGFVSVWGLPSALQELPQERATNAPTPVPSKVFPSGPTATLEPRAAAIATRDAFLTQTATFWTPTLTLTPTHTLTSTYTPTPTPTPNIEATINFELTQLYYEDATATASLWTPTPDPAISIAQTPVVHNTDWTPVVRQLHGVEMVLVPAGCFMMGSTEEQIDYAVSLGGRRDWFTDEQPAHEVCFEEPFWLDRYEVTNAQYGSTGCTSTSSEPEQPRNCVDWFDAQAFCEMRGARLPTEAEWEYAARGPDGLIYPWGNEFVGEYVIYEDSPEYGDTKTAPVGSRPNGASWVGALDMSGNVWEWTSSLYRSYPYDATDGRESPDSSDARVLRGGSFNYSSIALRAAYRGWGYPDNVNDNNGFRCARSIQ